MDHMEQWQVIIIMAIQILIFLGMNLLNGLNLVRHQLLCILCHPYSPVVGVLWSQGDLTRLPVFPCSVVLKFAVSCPYNILYEKCQDMYEVI